MVKIVLEINDYDELEFLKNMNFKFTGKINLNSDDYFLYYSFLFYLNEFYYGGEEN